MKTTTSTLPNNSYTNSIVTQGYVRILFLLVQAQRHWLSPWPAQASFSFVIAAAMAVFVFGPMGACRSKVWDCEHYTSLGKEAARMYGLPFAEYCVPEWNHRRWAQYEATAEEVGV